MKNSRRERGASRIRKDLLRLSRRPLQIKMQIHREPSETPAKISKWKIRVDFNQEKEAKH